MPIRKPHLAVLPSLLAFSALTLALPATAAVDAFLKIDGIEGESVVQGHEKEIDVLSWSFGASPSSLGNASGARSSTRTCADGFTINKRVDKASPTLFLSAVQGTILPTAKLTVRKTFGSGFQDFYTLTLSQVMVSSIKESSGPGDEGPEESITFVYGKMVIRYTPQNSAGGQQVTPVESTINGGCS